MAGSPRTAPLANRHRTDGDRAAAAGIVAVSLFDGALGFQLDSVSAELGIGAALGAGDSVPEDFRLRRDGLAAGGMRPLLLAVGNRCGCVAAGTGGSPTVSSGKNAGNHGCSSRVFDDTNSLDPAELRAEAGVSIEKWRVPCVQAS